MCSLVSVLQFLLNLWKTCQLMGENFVFLVIFDTCDVVYNWSISLLPPIVLDKLFAPAHINIETFCWNRCAFVYIKIVGNG